jgi:uncharacterized protein (UPF0335 family)
VSIKEYRKKPVVIEAVQLEQNNAIEVARWCGGEAKFMSPAMPSVFIRTLEGTMRADVGDFIIKGVQGEFYPCKPDIFAATYDEADDECIRLAAYIESLEAEVKRSHDAVLALTGRVERLEAECDALLAEHEAWGAWVDAEHATSKIPSDEEWRELHRLEEAHQVAHDNAERVVSEELLDYIERLESERDALLAEHEAVGEGYGDETADVGCDCLSCRIIRAHDNAERVIHCE